MIAKTKDPNPKEEQKPTSSDKYRNRLCCQYSEDGKKPKPVEDQQTIILKTELLPITVAR
jgi:hypothetical protein